MKGHSTCCICLRVCGKTFQKSLIIIANDVVESTHPSPCPGSSLKNMMSATCVCGRTLVVHQWFVKVV